MNNDRFYLVRKGNLIIFVPLEWNTTPFLCRNSDGHNIDGISVCTHSCCYEVRNEVGRRTLRDILYTLWTRDPRLNQQMNKWTDSSSYLIWNIYWLHLLQFSKHSDCTVAKYIIIIKFNIILNYTFKCILYCRTVVTLSSHSKWVLDSNLMVDGEFFCVEFSTCRVGFLPVFWFSPTVQRHVDELTWLL